LKKTIKRKKKKDKTRRRIKREINIKIKRVSTIENTKNLFYFQVLLPSCPQGIEGSRAWGYLP